MKVEMLTCQAGVDFVRNRGEIVDVGAEEGARMIAAGIATPLREAPSPERAVKARRAEKAEG